MNASGATSAPPADAARRLLRLGGASNFRDLGGYRTRDGLYVRWRRVFRSDRLDALNDKDWRQLAALGIDTIIDFRAAHERGEAARDWPVPRRVALPIESELAGRLAALRSSGTPVDAARMRTLMQQEYRRFVLDHAARFGEFLHTLADAQGGVVFHCAAGKDRTGIVAALLLGALGVDRATIEQDYLLTNDVYSRPDDLQAQGRTSGLPNEALEVLWSVHASHLHAAFDALDEVHGGLEPFLVGPVGLQPALRQRLADKLLEGG